MTKDDILQLTGDWNLHSEDLSEKKYFLFNVKDGDVIELNEVSFTILERLDGASTLGYVHNSILGEFEVGAERLWDDMIVLIEKCLGEGVLVKD